MNSALFSSGKSDWGTPQSLFDLLQERYRLQLDCAANERNAKLPDWLGPGSSLGEDALSFPWAPHRCWLNPPYGRDMGRWMHKASFEAQAGSLVVCLVPARTDTRWWHDHVMKHATSVELIRGRLRFEGASAGAPFPSAIITFEPGCAAPVRFYSVSLT